MMESVGILPLDQRPEGTRLLADARTGKIDTLYVYRLDRLGRDPRLILNAINEFESLGVQVKSMTEEFDTTNPNRQVFNNRPRRSGRSGAREHHRTLDRGD